MGFNEARYLLDEFPMFASEIMTESMKQKQIESLENQIMTAEAVRVGTLADRGKYMSWVKSKMRDIWKLRRTEEEKEKEAMKVWGNLAKKGVM